MGTQEKPAAELPRDFKASRLNASPFPIALAVNSVSALPRLLARDKRRVSQALGALEQE